MWSSCFVFVLLLVFVQSKEIQFGKCGGEVLSVDVEPCDSGEPCQIHRGNSAIITTRCLSNVNAEKLKLSIFAEISGVEVPYPGMKRNACVGKNLTCPIQEGKEIRYVQKLPVKSFFPKIETKAKFVLITEDDQDKLVCCFTAPVKVV